MFSTNWFSVDKPRESKEEKKAPAPVLGKGGRRGKRVIRKRRGAKGRVSSKLTQFSSVPAAMDTIPQVHLRMRFTVNSACTDQSSTFAEVAGALGGICTVTNSTIRHWASSIKVHRIIIWPAAATNAEVRWGLFANVGKEKSMVSSVPTGITTTGYVTSVPGKGTLCADWLTASDTSDKLFYITAGAGSVVELDVSYTLFSGVTTAGFSSPTSTVAAAVLGNIYYLALDGPAADVIRPLNLQTTA